MNGRKAKRTLISTEVNDPGSTGGQPSPWKTKGGQAFAYPPPESLWLVALDQLPVGSGMLKPSFCNASRTYWKRWYSESVSGPLYDSLCSLRGGYCT